MTRALSSSEAIGWCSLGPTAVARPRCCARWRANWRWAAAVDLAASARIGWLPQDDRALLPDDPELTAVGYLRSAGEMIEAEAYDHLHRFLFGHDIARASVSSLSPGELRRLALARLVLAGSNLLLLDEPTNHLDLPAREAFEVSLAGFEGATIMVTHDRYFIEQFARRVLAIETGKIEER